MTQSLTNLCEQVHTDSFRTICVPTWSETNQRFYYIVGCSGGGDEPTESLYSVDVAGNNRVEIEVLSTIFAPGEFSEFAVRTVGIHPHPSSGEIYLAVGSQGGDGTSLSNWRILKEDLSGDVEPMIERLTQEQYLVESIVSPNGNMMAVLLGYASYDVIEVVDLTTGEFLANFDVSPLNICDMIWADDTTLFYTVSSERRCSSCFSDQELWLFDLSSETTTMIVENTGEITWMLR
jgi:hypothetical protein